jgi:hypothetical protein
MSVVEDKVEYIRIDLISMVMISPIIEMNKVETNLRQNKVIHLDPSRKMPLDSWDLTKSAWMLPIEVDKAYRMLP